jgi:proline dehydrogenase
VLRAILLYLSKAGWARRLVTGWEFSRRAAARFVAGDTLEEAVQVVLGLNNQGLLASLDHLGEDVQDLQMAVRATDDYIGLLERLDDSGCRSYASLKLSQLGLNVDYELCLGNLRCIARRAADMHTFVRIDMEDSPTVDRTVRAFGTLRDEGLTNLGLVFQSYLFRSEADQAAALKLGARIRLVKGAYREPPEVAFRKKAQVDANFDRMTAALLSHVCDAPDGAGSSDGRFPPIAALGTHDERRIRFACRRAEELGLPKSQLEFQMLYGIRGDLQLSLAREGYPVRVYVPYGIQWYPYFARRLAERPANLWFFLSNLFRR